ncbi:hypothetical protein EI555_006294, partial [Monodon monoceros]
YETEKLSEDSFDCEFYPNRTLITYAIIIVTLESICISKVNPEASGEKSNWIPSRHSYEDLNQMMLQDDIMGKSLLSLLPDEEKNEVYQKIAVKLPLSSSACPIRKRNIYLWTTEVFKAKEAALEWNFCMLNLMLLPQKYGQVDVVMVDQYGSQESARVIKRKSFTYYDSSTSTLETIPEPPAPLSLPSFEVKPEVEHVEQMDQVGEMEQVDEEKEVHKVDQVHQEDQETLSFPSVTADVGNQSLHPPPSVIWYVNRREEELMKKFREQLEERTQMLRGEIWNQNHALEMLKEQLQSMQDSKLQVRGQFYIQPSTSRHIHSPEPQPLEPVPKKQCIEPVNRSLPDCKEAKQFCGSCSSYSFQFPEELEQPCDASSQEEGLQEQSQQHNVTVENHVLQILMPSQPGVSLPLDNTHMFTSTQHITVPVQLEAEQQLSSNYHGENPGGQEGRSHSFLLEAQQGPCLSPLLLAHNPSSEMISSTIIPQCQISSDSNLVMLQIPEDSNQLCQQPEDPQHHLYLQVETWPSSEQASLQDQVTWVQVPTPETEVQGSSGLQIFQGDPEHGPGQICYFMSAAPSN